MIAAMVTGTALIQSSFFRQSIVDHETMILRDMINALASEKEITADDFSRDANDAARMRFDESFGSLYKLRGTLLIKVFDRNNTIVWSSDPLLLGSKRTMHPDRLAKAMEGQAQAVFNTGHETIGDTGVVAGPETIECYIPIWDSKAGDMVIGVLSIYRNPQNLNQTIQHGLYPLWTVIGGMGIVLFFGLYQVFSVVYGRQQTAELKFSKLSVEHERIVQIEKMSAMGELVGEIAHQLNNPLVGVINLAQLAEREVDNPRRVSELLSDVRRAGTECRDIVQRILRINGASRSERQATDIGDLIRDTITFCQHSIELRHEIAFEMTGQPVLLEVDPVLIRQALFNLIHNAILSAPGKPVTVALSPANRDDVVGIRIDVIDIGNGFDKATEARLFKPFFTTRTNGTGLGLPVAQHIAMKHGGVILAESLSEGGARFSIWLPMTAPT